jgi:Kef-type K+ transport system membrane component KefB
LGKTKVFIFLSFFFLIFFRTPGANARFTVVVILLFGIFFCSWITEIIGVHAIFGAFILGVVVPRQNQFAQALTERIEDLVVVVLLPFYFTYSGLRTDIGSLR